MIIEKLTQPSAHLNRDDLSANQKKLLWETMMRHGASQGFAYDRFFKEGFQQWELQGIADIKRRFLNEHLTELFPDGDATQEAIDSICQNDGEFYRTLGRVFGLKKVFTDYMGTLGMGSNSVLNKFSVDDWKDYERIGITAVMREFEQEVVQVE